jgi:hypothetical protein
VVSELRSCLYISGKRRKEEAKEDRVVGGLCDDCLQLDNSRECSHWDCRMKLSTQDCRSDSNRFARKVDKNNNMATERHKHVERKKLELMSATEMDEELVDIKR